MAEEDPLIFGYGFGYGLSAETNLPLQTDKKTAESTDQQPIPPTI